MIDEIFFRLWAVLVTSVLVLMHWRLRMVSRRLVQAEDALEWFKERATAGRHHGPPKPPPWTRPSSNR